MQQFEKGGEKRHKLFLIDRLVPIDVKQIE